MSGRRGALILGRESMFLKSLAVAALAAGTATAVSAAGWEEIATAGSPSRDWLT